MSGQGSTGEPEEMSDQVFAQVLLTLNEVAICFADMPPKVSEGLHHVLDQSSEEQACGTQLPIEIKCEHQHLESKLQQCADPCNKGMESEFQRHCVHQEELSNHHQPGEHQEVEHHYCAQPLSTHNRLQDVEHQYCAESETESCNLHHTVEHQYCEETESQLYNKQQAVEHQYCAQPEPINRPLQVEHQYCAEPEEVQPRHRHQEEHQYCAEIELEPRSREQEAEHQHCTELDIGLRNQDLEHQYFADPENEPNRRQQDMEHQYCAEPETESSKCHQYCAEQAIERTPHEVEHQYCANPNIELNNNQPEVKSQEHAEAESRMIYVVRELGEYADQHSQPKNEHLCRESQLLLEPKIEISIGEIDSSRKEYDEPQSENSKRGVEEDQDSYSELHITCVEINPIENAKSGTETRNTFLQTVQDYVQPESKSESFAVCCKEKAGPELGGDCMRICRVAYVEPEVGSSSRCIAVYHDAYSELELESNTGAAGVYHEYIKQVVDESNEYTEKNQEKYAEPNYRCVTKYCEEADASDQCLVVYHGEFAEHQAEPSNQCLEGDHEEYTLQLELLEAASEVSKDHVQLSDQEEAYGRLNETHKKQDSPAASEPELSNECENANDPSTSPTLLQSTVSPNKSHTCAECGKSFSRNSNLIIHRRTHTGEKPFKCAQCGKSFVSSSKLIAHERTHTEPKPRKRLKKDTEVWDERIIPKHTSGKAKGKEEQENNSKGKIKHDKKRRGIEYEDQSPSLQTDVHKSNKLGRKKGVKKTHVCIECGRNFSRLSNLVNHHRTHTGEKPYECVECGKRFSDVANMITHGRVHTGEKPFACGRCGKSFSRLSNMKTHQRMHTGEKPYPCNQCDKRFSHSSHLVTHQQLHTGERPHTCDECGKSFSRLANMLTHQKLHKGEKPYLCNVCFKRFNRSSHLTKHLQMHVKEDLLMREDALRMEQQVHIREHIILLQ